LIEPIFEETLEEGQGSMVAAYSGLGEGIDPLVIVEGDGPEAVIGRLADLPIGGTDPEFAGQVQMPKAALIQQIDGFLANRTVTVKEGNLAEVIEARRDGREGIISDRCGAREIESTFQKIAGPPEDLRIAQMPYCTEEPAGLF